MVRCLIVDDSQRFAEAARALLERQGLQVVGIASNAADALRLTQQLRPDVTLLDIDLGDESGFEVARQLQRDTLSPVIFTSTHAEQDYRDLVSASTALGFLPKATLSAAAIHLLLEGDSAGRPG
jgi:DNA-binding NarL/FixJ family response regulator